MDDDQQGIPMMTGVGKPLNDKRGGGLGRITGSFIDEGLDWSDLPWLRRHWKGKIVLKGIMCAADASRAAQEGLDGIVVRYVTWFPPQLFPPSCSGAGFSSPLFFFILSFPCLLDTHSID